MSWQPLDGEDPTNGEYWSNDDEEIDYWEGYSWWDNLRDKFYAWFYSDYYDHDVDSDDDDFEGDD